MMNIIPFSGFDAFFDAVDSMFDDIQTVNSQVPKFRKDVCTSSFPPSSLSVDEKTKSLHILVALAGLNEKDICLNFKNDVLTLTVNKQKDKDSQKAYFYKGLKLMENGEVQWTIDRGKFDVDHAEVTFVDGLLEVTVPPTEAAKPKEKKLFGSLDLKALEDAKKKEDESSEEDK